MLFSVERGKLDKGKVMPTKQNTDCIKMIKMLENCFSKAESKKQILEIWQKLSERDVAFCCSLGKIAVQNRSPKTFYTTF